MSWTDDRVEKLSKLWADGLTASQIAKELGGVTRNAVIGKVHRLGLSGRAKPKAASTSTTRTKRTTTTTSKSNIGSGGSSASRPVRAATTARSVGSAALKMEEAVDAVADTRPQEDVVVPMSKRLTLLQLTENTCKWPSGDPQNPDFHFCGHNTKDEAPYCEFHSKVAYHPLSERRNKARR